MDALTRAQLHSLSTSITSSHSNPVYPPPTYFGSATQLEGEQNIFLPCAGSELHAAPSAPQTSFHTFYHHLTPSRARIRRVEKLLPPSGPPPNTVALNPRTRKLKTWKNQGEHQHWTAHLSSMAAPEILIVLGLYARSRTRTQGESNPRALTRM